MQREIEVHSISEVGQDDGESTVEWEEVTQMTKVRCGHCHTCGSVLVRSWYGGKPLPVGEEFCPSCQLCRRYISHGWRINDAMFVEDFPCPGGGKEE